MESGSAILEKQVTQLKAELKEWEKAFAAAHGGRKAGRDDIKNDASISAKYREFNRLRRPIDPPRVQAETRRKPRHLRPSSQHTRSALRERSGNEVTTTPSKAWKSIVSLEVVQEEQEAEPTPAFIRCALGPTPQKDGQVLGIFDLANTATPSKSGERGAAAALPIISDTPSKPTAPPASSDHQPSATPQSSNKRRLLDAFAGTPLKRQRHDDGQTPSTAKRHYATPSFLRRSFPLAPVEEETATAAPPLKKRGLVRSLSSIIQGLRKHEEKRMDDEWDILNELEAEEDGNTSQAQQPEVLVEDSQVAEMPLGPDQGAPGSDSEDDKDTRVLGADGKPRKPWKKKGLKRQTKRTNMRPVLHKPKKASDLEVGDEEGEDEAVGETQVTEEGAEDAEGSDDGTDDGEHFQPKRKKPKAGDASPAKKAPKKVSAQAHANFRRLNIKNKNSKANGRGGRKFGRR